MNTTETDRFPITRQAWLAHRYEQDAAEAADMGHYDSCRTFRLMSHIADARAAVAIERVVSGCQ